MSAWDVVAATEFLRPSLGASRDAGNEAVDNMGKVEAAAVLVIIYQRYSDDVAKGALSRNSGGYFRSMARRFHEREIDLETECRELRRRRLA